MHKVLSSFILLCLFLLSCSSGKKSTRTGRLLQCHASGGEPVKKQPPTPQQAIQAVKESYPMSLNYFKGKIDYSLSSNATFKYSEVVDYYEKMNRLSDEISRCPAALKLFPQLNYFTTELDQTRKLAADEQYSAGLKNEKINTRISWEGCLFKLRAAPTVLCRDTKMSNAGWMRPDIMPP